MRPFAPLPSRAEVRQHMAAMQQGRGAAALARRLYVDERMSLDEIATWLQRPRKDVAAMLRTRRQPSRAARATRALNRWLAEG